MFRTIVLTLMMVASLAASGLVPPDLTANNFILVREGDVCEGDVLMIGAYDYFGEFYFLSQKFVKDKVKLAGVAASKLGDEVSETLLWTLKANEKGHILQTKDGSSAVKGGAKNAPDLELVDAKQGTAWTLVTHDDNTLTLRSNDDDSRYLSISGYDGVAYFGYYTESYADAINLYFYRYEDPTMLSPSSTLSDGLLRLSGTWTAEELSALSFSDVGALDMTSIRLPLDARAFAHYPEYANIPIYVSASQGKRVPAEWDFVVCGGQLLRKTQLADAQPLFLPYPISVDDGQMTYERQFCGDGGWETLVLPFDADVPEQVEALRLKEVEGDKATFVHTKKIYAGEPVLIRPEKDSAKSENFGLKSQKNQFSSVENRGGIFCGTLLGQKLTEDSGEIYMLSADGATFSRALAGSSLSPFRAYLRLSSGYERVRIFMTTGVSQPLLLTTDGGQRYYDLSGRPFVSAKQGIRVGKDGKKLSL